MQLAKAITIPGCRSSLRTPYLDYVEEVQGGTHVHFPSGRNEIRRWVATQSNFVLRLPTHTIY